MPLGGKIDRLLEKAGIWLLTEKQTEIVLLDKVWLCCLMVNFSFTIGLFLWTYFFFITIFITYFLNWRVTSDYQIYAWQNYHVKMP